ncbi:MAG: SpoIIE family protein phosphatase, partial [SAR324 cluster bacterium]|nr:SpoIIE family protein phosphatase [SAR324 cluster bacterium]
MPQQPQQLRFQIIPEVYRVGEALHKAGGRPVLVGGWVRDALLGIPHRRDFDIEVFGLAMGRLRTTLARIGPVHAVGRHFGVLKLTTHEAEYDISVPRRESNIGKGHRGFLVEPDPHMSFDEAAARRDFTINAMGYAFLDDALLDPFGGERDLREGILRHVGPAFGEDPLRVLRAMQFAGRFDLRIVPQTLELCRSLDLGELPRERIWEELKKLLLRALRPSHGFGYAEGLGVLAYFPELRRLHDAGGNLPWAGDSATLEHLLSHLATVEQQLDRVTGQLRDLEQQDHVLQQGLAKLNQQMARARQLQDDLLPRSLPESDSLRISTLYVPANELSGDVYDVVRLGDRQLSINISDATGHDMAAAMLSIFMKQSLRAREAAAHQTRPAGIEHPHELLSKLNDELVAADLSDCHFLTSIH